MKKDDRKRPDSLTSILGGDAVFDGSLSLDGSLRIDGSFDGSLACGASVTIGEQGRFNGDLQAEEVILGGKISGSVVARKLVVLEATSTFEGDLTCGCLHVNEGAVFNGTSAMGDQAVESRLKQANDEDENLKSVPSIDPQEEVPDSQKTDDGMFFSPSDSESDSEIRDRRG
ncbi:polymer-forming cytoskeletal [bacterium BMS3Bbin04]|nr:polymer-forming cytoskeletal [bacterium BMS3Bbin04]